MFCLFVICNARAQSGVNKREEYRIKQSDKEWTIPATIIEPELVQHSKRVPQSIFTPDSLFITDRSEKIMKMTGLFKVLKEVKEEGFFYSSNKNRIIFIEKGPRFVEEKSFLFVPGLISLIFMVAYIFLLRSNYDFTFATIAGITAIAATIITAITALTSATSFLAIFAGLAIFIAFNNRSHKAYKIFTTIYFFLIVLYFIFMFLGI